MSSVLERIRVALTQKQNDVTPELLLDCVWLAITIRRDSRQFSYPPPNDQKNANVDSDDIEDDSEADPDFLESDSPQGYSDQNRTTNEATGDNAAAIVASGAGDENQMRGTLIALPSAPTLSHMLEIERSLRGLRRRVLSKHQFSVSVEETTNWIAETGCLRIITKPKSERFLNGYVIIDHSPTMRFWQEPLREFRRLLWRLGAFKSLTAFHLNSFSDTPRLYADASFACPLPPSGITKHVGTRNLVLFCTDAHSPSWRSGGTDEFLNSFHCNANVVVINVLDSNAWRRTALAKTRFVTATNRRNSSRSLASPTLLDNSSIAKNGLRPIVSLTPKSLSRLASFVYGESGNQITSYIIRDSQGKPSKESNTNWQPTEQAAEVAYKTFCDLASPSTIRLARCLACMPLFLPIMRLVQQVMHPETELHQLSEIFNSGMLHRREYSTSISDETNPDEIEYDFMPGLRDRFLDDTSFMRIAKCTELLDDYLNSRFGQSNSFAAILRDPSKAEDWPSGEAQHNQAPFARVFSNTLKRLGGQYAVAANLLEPKPNPVSRNSLLTVDKIHEAILASGELEEGDRITSEQLLFDNHDPRQHTWLVATKTKVIIVLDDENTRAKERLVQRVMNKNSVFPLSFGPESVCTVGFAAKPDPKWYYSVELFPTQQSLREAILRLTQISPDEATDPTEFPYVTPELISAHASSVENNATQEDADELRLGYPFADVALEDGTNVRKGTVYVEKPDSWPADLYIPAKASETEGWYDRLRHLQEEFTRIANDEDRVSCRITQSLIPQFPNARHSNIWIEESQERMFQGGGGLSRDFCRLEGLNGEWLEAEFPFADVKGVSIQNSAGQPYAFRYGLSRSIFLLRDAKRRDNNARISNACLDGTRLLYELPAMLATHIWANWETGFSEKKNSDEYFWLNALFEIGWQKSASRKLRLSRFAWSGQGRSRVVLPNGPLFPRLPTSMRYHESISTDIPHYMGYPVEFFSELQDVSRYSVDAIDHLLSLSDKPFDFYVCHCSSDEGLAKELIDRLSDTGLKSFVHREVYLPSEDFSEIALRATSECKLFLVVASESSFSSKLQMRELDIAFERQRKDRSLKIVTLTLESSQFLTEAEPRLNSTLVLSLRKEWHEVLDSIHALLPNDRSGASRNDSLYSDLVVEFKRIDSVKVQDLRDWVKGQILANIRSSNVQVSLHPDLTAWLSYCQEFEKSREWYDLPENTREQVQNLTRQILVKEIPDLKRGIEIILRDFQGDDCKRFAEIIRQFVEAKVVAILRVLCSMRCVGMKSASWHSRYEKMFPQFSTDIMAGLVVKCMGNKSETCYWTEVDVYRNGEKTGLRAYLPFTLILRQRLKQPINEQDIDCFLAPQFVDHELRSQNATYRNYFSDALLDFVDRREDFWETEEFKRINRDAEMLVSIRRAASSVLQQYGPSTLTLFSGDSESWSQVVSELNTPGASLAQDDTPITVSVDDSEYASIELSQEQRQYLRGILENTLPSRTAIKNFIDDIAIDHLAEGLRGNLSDSTLDRTYHEMITIAHARCAVGDLLLELSRHLGPKGDDIAVAGAQFAQKYQRAKSASTRDTFFSLEQASIERLTIEAPFLSAKQLAEFLGQAERRICAVKCYGKREGTGFLIGEDLILTCFHVIEDGNSGKPLSASNIEVEFDFLDHGTRPTTTYALDSDWVIPYSKYSEQDLKEPPGDAEPDALDFALLKLAKVAGEDIVDGRERGFFDIGTGQMPSIGTPILIAGHAGREALQPLSFSMAAPGYEGLSPNKTRIIYKTGTARDSSGSPVFDHQFNVIGLHHNRGEIDTTNSRHYKNNRGIPVMLIAKALSGRIQIASAPVSTGKHLESQTGFAAQARPEPRNGPFPESAGDSGDLLLQKRLVDWLRKAPPALQSRIGYELEATSEMLLGIAPTEMAVELVRWAVATKNLDRLALLIRNHDEQV